MDVMMSIRPPYSDLIFQEKKLFEFRNTLPEQEIDTVYVYETLNGGGTGKVIGKFKAGKPIEMLFDMVEGYFIADYCRKILKDDHLAGLFQEAVNSPMESYKVFSAIYFALNKPAMDYIKENKTWPPYSVSCRGSNEEAEKIITRVSMWLEDTGLENQNYAIPIIDPVEYLFPLDISDFCSPSGKALTRPPQSWQYVKRKGE